MIVLNLDVKVSEPRTYDDKEVSTVYVGQRSIGSLYRDVGTENWYVYGYIMKEQKDMRGRHGYLREILGESPSPLEMTKRLLAWEGYIPSNQEIHLRGSGLVHSSKYDEVKLVEMEERK